MSVIEPAAVRRRPAFDPTPIILVIGVLLAMLGGAMLLPTFVDFVSGNDNWQVFGVAAITTSGIGLSMFLATRGTSRGLSTRQAFIMTVLVWITLSAFGALPIYWSEAVPTYTDAFFEAMSGLTTTGSTVITGLEDLPRGLLLWRGLLQWFGGIGIVVVAMVFLPELRVGGMQIFRSEGFDTLGKILPRATEIARQISVIYLTITALCAIAYIAAGMGPFDAIVHSMTTVATGGFSNYDESFQAFPVAVEYVAIFFMIAAALPFVRFVQMVGGDGNAIFRDAQVRAFLILLALLVIAIGAWMIFENGSDPEFSFRKALFNTTSLLTGTGYASANYMAWGAFPIALLFFVGLVGGCAGSTSCSVKIFRYQLLISSLKAQIRKIHSPRGIFAPKYAGRKVGDDVLSSVMSFFVFFIVTLGVVSILLSMTGLDIITSVSGAAAALANIGPGLGDVIGPEGNFSSLKTSAKWILSAAMLVGRLELLAVYVMFTLTFWRE